MASRSPCQAFFAQVPSKQGVDLPAACLCGLVLSKTEVELELTSPSPFVEIGSAGTVSRSRTLGSHVKPVAGLKLSHPRLRNTQIDPFLLFRCIRGTWTVCL